MADFVYLPANSSISSWMLQAENNNLADKLFIGLKQENFGNVAEIEHLGAAVAVCSCVREGIKGRLNPGKFC
jgi:hypothetical protein